MLLIAKIYTKDFVIFFIVYKESVLLRMAQNSNDEQRQQTGMLFFFLSFRIQLLSREKSFATGLVEVADSILGRATPKTLKGAL